MRLLSIAGAALVLAGLACGNAPRATPPPAVEGAALQTAQLGDPVVEWEYSTAPFAPLAVAPDSLGRPFLYVAQQDGGLLVLDVSEEGTAARAAVITKQQLGDQAATGIAQRDSVLYISLGNFFGDGQEAGLAAVSIADPEHPSVESIWGSGIPGRGSSGVLLHGDYAYLAAMSSGMFIFDITDPGRPRMLSSIQPDVNFPRTNPNSTQHPNARGSAIHQNVLFVAYDAGGLRAIDVSHPTSPVEIGRYINQGPGAKQQAYNNVIVDWPHVFAAVDYCGLEVINVEDPTDMRQVGWWNPWQCESASNIWFNSAGHTNQMVYNPELKVIHLSAGDSELQVVDVSDPREPRLIDQYGAPKDGLGAWGVGASAETLYLTYVQALIPFKGDWAGIKALQR